MRKLTCEKRKNVIIGVIYENYSSIKSPKCNRSAFTDILISQKDKPKEISKHNMLLENK